MHCIVSIIMKQKNTFYPKYSCKVYKSLYFKLKLKKKVLLSISPYLSISVNQQESAKVLKVVCKV